MEDGSRAGRRNLVVLCVASAGWAFSFGLGAPLASLWLHQAGLSAKAVGLNTSVYYLGIALASAVVPWLMTRAGRGCLVGGMVVDAVTTALFPWIDSPAAWFVLRLAGGVGSAMSLIPMETRVNRNAPPERRARDFGWYAFSVATGIGLGTVCGLPLYPVAPRLAFGLGGIVTFLAAVLAHFMLPPEATTAETRAGGAGLGLWRQRFPLGTAWAQGFLEGGCITFLSIYLLGLGHDEAAVSGLMGVLFLGVVLIQVPVACLADRLGRLRVVLGCHLVLLASLAWLPFCVHALPLAAWLFVVGASCAALYPLGLALLGERVPAGAMAQANAWYLASNCAGSLSGPLVIGLSIDRFGPRALFAAAAAAVVLVVAAAGRRRRASDQSGAAGRGSGAGAASHKMAG
jgi:MFS family permease